MAHLSSSFNCMIIVFYLFIYFNIMEKCESKVAGCFKIDGCAGYDWCYASRCKPNAILDYGCYNSNEVPVAARSQYNRDWCHAILEVENRCGGLPEEERQTICYSCDTDYCHAANCTKAFCAGNPSTENGVMDTTENLMEIGSSVIMESMSTTVTTTNDVNPGGTNMTTSADASSVPPSSIPTTTMGKSSKPNKARWTFPPKDSLPLFHFEFMRESDEDQK